MTSKCDPNAAGGATASICDSLLRRVLASIELTLDEREFEIARRGHASGILAAIRPVISDDDPRRRLLEKLGRQQVELFGGRTWRAGRFDAALYCCRGHLARRRAVVLSSRLGRSPESNPRWFDALRTLCARLDPETCLIASKQQTVFRFARRLADWYSFGLVEFCQRSFEQFKADWREGRLPIGFPDRQWMVRIDDGRQSRSPDDDWLAGVADEIFVLSARRGGNIERIVKRLLGVDGATGANADRPLVRVLADGASKKSAAQDLIQRGALPWIVLGGQRRSPQEKLSVGQTNMIALTDFECSKYVSHFTRRPIGRWIDEAEASYLDRLLFDSPGVSRGAMEALLRILTRRALIGGNRLTRGATRVVSFTGRALTEFATLRSYQQHLGRWDFEPYGMAIEREYFRTLGGRPVVYGDETTWANMPDVERPFFQLARSKDGDHDWTVEQEWRIVGDLELCGLDRDKVIVFVGNDTDALQIADVCPFPIATLSGHNDRR